MSVLRCSFGGIDESGRFEEEDTDSLLRDRLWKKGSVAVLQHQKLREARFFSIPPSFMLWHWTECRESEAGQSSLFQSRQRAVPFGPLRADSLVQRIAIQE